MATIADTIASAAYQKYGFGPQTESVMIDMMLFWRRELISCAKQLDRILVNDDFDVDCFRENANECTTIIQCKNDDKQDTFLMMGFPSKDKE